jgi:hypothetical protein
MPSRRQSVKPRRAKSRRRLPSKGMPPRRCPFGLPWPAWDVPFTLPSDRMRGRGRRCRRRRDHSRHRNFQPPRPQRLSPPGALSPRRPGPFRRPPVQARPVQARFFPARVRRCLPRKPPAPPPQVFPVRPRRVHRLAVCRPALHALWRASPSPGRWCRRVPILRPSLARPGPQCRQLQRRRVPEFPERLVLPCRVNRFIAVPSAPASLWLRAPAQAARHRPAPV